MNNRKTRVYFLFKKWLNISLVFLTFIFNILSCLARVPALWRETELKALGKGGGAHCVAGLYEAM